MFSRPYPRKGRRNRRRKPLRSQREALQQDLEFEEQEIWPIKDILTKVQQSSQTNLAPLKSLEGRYFRLWSTDHVKYCTAEVAPTRYIEFYDAEFQPFDNYPEGQVNGHIYAVPEIMCDIDPFVHPQNVGLETFRIDGNHSLHTFHEQFLDNHHLILQIPKELVFYRQKKDPPSKAPDVFTYYGICEAYEESRISQSIGERTRQSDVVQHLLRDHGLRASDFL
ncbi:hypothetical protein F52700_1932 [Fusarium sp. NRRL 52700]|nr:hypothetical protein F52700_1932 [Fusarium sp. NRRL 52700]